MGVCCSLVLKGICAVSRSSASRLVVDKDGMAVGRATGQKSATLIEACCHSATAMPGNIVEQPQ